MQQTGCNMQTPCDLSCCVRLQAAEGQVAIFDATNTTEERRRLLVGISHVMLITCNMIHLDTVSSNKSRVEECTATLGKAHRGGLV
eukprot:1139293-Pelagomonas_calceolata.AAC.7